MKFQGIESTVESMIEEKFNTLIKLFQQGLAINRSSMQVSMPEPEPSLFDEAEGVPAWRVEFPALEEIFTFDIAIQLYEFGYTFYPKGVKDFSITDVRRYMDSKNKKRRGRFNQIVKLVRSRQLGNESLIDTAKRLDREFPGKTLNSHIDQKGRCRKRKPKVVIEKESGNGIETE